MTPVISNSLYQHILYSKDKLEKAAKEMSIKTGGEVL